MISKAKVTLSKNSIFYLAIAVYVISTNLQASYMYNTWFVSSGIMILVLKMMRYITYVLCFYRIYVIKKLSYKMFLFSAAFACIALASAITGPEKTPIFYALILIASIETDFKRIVKIFMSIQFLFLVFLVSFSLLGFIGDSYTIDNGVQRFFLGYGWVNRAPYCWMFLILEYLYLKKCKLTISEFCIAIIFSLVFYKKTVTDFPFILSLALANFGLFKYIKYNFSYYNIIKKKLISRFYLIVFFFVVSIGVSIPFIYKSDNYILSTINKVVNYRFSLANTAIERYNIGLFGHNIKWTGASTLLFGMGTSNQYFYVDCDYIKLSLEYGVVFTGLITATYVFGIIIAGRYKEYNVCFCLLFVGILCIFEPRLIDFAFNPFIFYCFSKLKFSDIQGNMMKNIRVVI